MQVNESVKADIVRVVIVRRDAEGNYIGTIEIDDHGNVKHIAAGCMTDGDLVLGSIHAID